MNKTDGVYSIDGRVLDHGDPIVNVELVRMLDTMASEARAGRLVAFAGVIGAIEDGKLSLRLATHTNNWEIHDRLLARIGVLRTMMETDLIEKMRIFEKPLQGGGDDGGGDNAA